jgi:hypothetical protein
MSLPILLFILRLVSALLLLGFLGLITWLMLKDLQLLSEKPGGAYHSSGSLVVLESQSNSPPEGARFSLVPVTTIGRAASNTIVIDDEFSSNDHAKITWLDRQWWLEDLGSSNGTLLNDLLINKATVITSGDLITVGQTQLRLHT